MQEARGILWSANFCRRSESGAEDGPVLPDQAGPERRGRSHLHASHPGLGQVRGARQKREDKTLPILPILCKLQFSWFFDVGVYQRADMVPEAARRRHDVRPGGDHHVQAPGARRHLEEGGFVRGKTVRGLKLPQLCNVLLFE